MQTHEEKVTKKKKEIDGLAKGVDEWEFFDINKNLPELNRKDFSHVSTNLLKEYGYYQDGKLRRGCFNSLLIQARRIVENEMMSLGSIPPVIFGKIQIPDFKTGEILIVQNVDGKTTIKLPLDD